MKRLNPKQPRATLSAISLSRFKSRLNTSILVIQDKEDEDEGDLTTTESTIIREDLDSLRDVSNVVLIKLKEGDKFRCSPRFHISQHFKLLDANTGQSIYFIGKKRQSCGRCCCGRHRGYEMYVFSPAGQIIMMMGRKGPFECCMCCDHACDDDDDDRYGGGNTEPSTARLTPSETLSIQNALVSHAGSGAAFGTLKNYSSAITPQYAILDKMSRLIMIVQGPRFGNVISCMNNSFRLYNVIHESATATEENKNGILIIGEISRGGTIPSGADLSVIYGSAIVTADFPKALPCYAKAMIIAAMVEMNVTYFDRVLAVSDLLAILFISLLLSATILYFYFTIKYFM